MFVAQEAEENEEEKKEEELKEEEEEDNIFENTCSLSCCDVISYPTKSLCPSSYLSCSNNVKLDFYISSP